MAQKKSKSAKKGRETPTTPPTRTEIEEPSSSCEIVPRVLAGSSLVSHRGIVSPNGLWLLCICGAEVRIYSCSHGDLVSVIRDKDFPQTPITGICFNSTSPHSQIYVVSEDGRLRLFNYEAGVAVRTWNLEGKVVGIYSPYRSHGIFLLAKSRHAVDWQQDSGTADTSCTLFHIPSLETGGKELKRVSMMKNISADSSKVSFDPQGDFFAVVNDNALCLHFFKNSQYKKHLMSGRTFTCLAIHPKERCIATGDSQGRILLWRCFEEQSHVTRSILHWHSAAVLDLAFSAEGSYLWSGGYESTLVQWSLNQTDQKDFLPRLGAPITHLSISHGNNIIVASHADSVITLVGLQRNIICTISSLYWSHLAVSSAESEKVTEIRPILTVEPRTRCLALRGKPGQVQLFDATQHKLRAPLDVVGQNILSSGLNNFTNANVDAIAFGAGQVGDVSWMCTADSLVTRHVGSVLNLKFWLFDDIAQKYVVNTTVVDPHDSSPVRWIEFSPASPDGTVATLSDTNFKIWIALKEKTITGRRTVWGCTGIGRFQDAKPPCCVFSRDGATLAVAFGTVVTFWDVGRVTLRDSVLVSPETIRNIAYGPAGGDSFLVTTDRDVAVWSLKTMTCGSRHQISGTVLTANPTGSLYCVSSSDAVAVLDGESGELLYQYTFPSSPGLIACLLDPVDTDVHPNQVGLNWYEKNRLFLLSSKGELWVVDGKSTGAAATPQAVPLVDPDLHLTPFAHLRAQQAEDLKTIQILHNGAKYEQKDSYIARLSSVAAYTLPKPDYFLTEHLNSILGLEHLKETKSIHPTPEAMEVDATADSDDDDMAAQSPRKESSGPVETAPEPESGYLSESFDHLASSVKLLQGVLPAKKSASKKSPFVNMSQFVQALRLDGTV